MAIPLEITELTIEIAGKAVVREVNLRVSRGEMLAFVGASGSGKSMTALAAMGLLPKAASITSGMIMIDGVDVTTAAPAEMRALRARKAGMVFQEPLTCLNPVMSIGAQMNEPLIHTMKMGRKEACEKSLQALREVRIDDPERVFRSFPHQLSGGMRQRVMIAMALSCDPVLLLADEPTTALDVTVQARVVEILSDLRERRNLAIVFITHDIALAATVASRMAILSEGEIVEQGPVAEVVRNPKHAYTQKLVLSAKRREDWMKPA